MSTSQKTVALPASLRGASSQRANPSAYLLGAVFLIAGWLGSATTAWAQDCCYGATGLPPGLCVDSNSGAITGTPTVMGVYPVTISATNASGTTVETLTISVQDVTADAGSPAMPVWGLASLALLLVVAGSGFVAGPPSLRISGAAREGASCVAVRMSAIVFRVEAESRSGYGVAFPSRPVSGWFWRIFFCRGRHSKASLLLCVSRTRGKMKTVPSAGVQTPFSSAASGAINLFWYKFPRQL